MSLSVTELNSNLTCKLCDGYLINATTIVDCYCSQSFCKSCLLKHLEKTKRCPKCKFVLKKDDLEANLRYDSILQSLVYKIIPNLYLNEYERRINFYKEHPQDKINDELDKFREESIFWNSNELIDISIEYLPKSDQHSFDQQTSITNDYSPLIYSRAKRRYLRVECGMKVAHLKKWIQHKIDLPYTHRVIVLFNNEILDDSLKMIDLAYIFSKTSCQLNLHYYCYKISNGKKKISKSKFATNKKLKTSSKLSDKIEKMKLSKSEFTDTIKADQKNRNLLTLNMTKDLVSNLNGNSEVRDERSHLSSNKINANTKIQLQNGSKKAIKKLNCISRVKAARETKKINSMNEATQTLNGQTSKNSNDKANISNDKVNGQDKIVYSLNAKTNKKRLISSDQLNNSKTKKQRFDNSKGVSKNDKISLKNSINGTNGYSNGNLINGDSSQLNRF